MISIISGTNRKNSEALRFSKLIEGIYLDKGAEVQLLALEEIPHEYFFPEMYEDEVNMPASLLAIQERYLWGAEKFHFVMPEYNGGVPGALKLFIDAVSVRDLKKTFHGKKAALTGVSSGRAGNLRGMDQLTAILNFLNVTVLPLQQPVSSIHKLVDEQGNITDPGTLKVLEKQIDVFLTF